MPNTDHGRCRSLSLRRVGMKVRLNMALAVATAMAGWPAMVLAQSAAPPAASSGTTAPAAVPAAPAVTPDAAVPAPDVAVPAVPAPSGSTDISSLLPQDLSPWG